MNGQLQTASRSGAEIAESNCAHLLASKMASAPEFTSRLKQIYAAQRIRRKTFDTPLIGDPAWEILLYVFIATSESRAVTVGEACQIESASQATAQRYVNYMVDRGLLQRSPNASDKRSSILTISESGISKMISYLELVTYC